MAVLGKIRERSIFLILVIGMALFAFVISGVFTDPGMSSQEPIGKVNGEDISIEEFRNQVDFLETNYNLSGMVAVNNVWDQTVRNKVLKTRSKTTGSPMYAKGGDVKKPTKKVAAKKNRGGMMYK